ncbi:MAG: hypothetical protein R6U04_02875 [Bacteroidales bacterium]
MITLYLLGLNAFTNKILAGAELIAFVIGFTLKAVTHLPSQSTQGKLNIFSGCY